jgi:hypothetical protein
MELIEPAEKLQPISAISYCLVVGLMLKKIESWIKSRESGFSVVCLRKQGGTFGIILFFNKAVLEARGYTEEEAHRRRHF